MLFAIHFAVLNKVKVIISCLPPRYVRQWDEWQYTEHWDINECIVDNMMFHQVSLAEQSRLSCPPGKTRSTRFRETGDLTDHGTFLLLKNMVTTLRSPASSSKEATVHRSGPHRDWEQYEGKSEKKLMKLFQTFLKKHLR